MTKERQALSQAIASSSVWPRAVPRLHNARRLWPALLTWSEQSAGTASATPRGFQTRSKLVFFACTFGLMRETQVDMYKSKTKSTACFHYGMSTVKQNKAQFYISLDKYTLSPNTGHVLWILKITLANRAVLSSKNGDWWKKSKKKERKKGDFSGAALCSPGLRTTHEISVLPSLLFCSLLNEKQYLGSCVHEVLYVEAIASCTPCRVVRCVTME